MRTWLGAALLPLALATAGCGATGEDEPALLTTDGGTLAQSIAAHADLATADEALSLAQLSEVFDGAGSYTVLAPTDAAFEALGGKAEQLLTLEQRPLLVGLLREHVLPGHVTTAAILTAIESSGGNATMTTLGGGTVRFDREGETIVATHSNGGVARLVATAVESDNGVALPIDAVLTASNPSAAPVAQ